METPDYFQFFGLAPKLALDSADLQARFYRLSRELHPDRFQRATPAERERSLEASAILNDAYRTLRDPVARAEYLLKLRGMAADSKQAPPELLEEVFALNEALEELRGGEAHARSQIEAARGRFLALRQETDERIEALSRRWDEGDTEALSGIRAVLNRRRYITNLLAQVESELVP
jgi:molecular chaperone HscB